MTFPVRVEGTSSLKVNLVTGTQDSSTFSPKKLLFFGPQGCDPNATAR